MALFYPCVWIVCISPTTTDIIYLVLLILFQIPSHGSFLRRNKATLAKIAELSKPASKLGGARQSGNFVFTARSPDKKEQDDPKRPQVKTKCINKWLN